MLNDKNILITGGTGSFGKKCTEIILKRYKPNKLIIFSRDELKQFEMAQIFWLYPDFSNVHFLVYTIVSEDNAFHMILK